VFEPLSVPRLRQELIEWLLPPAPGVAFFRRMVAAGRMIFPVPRRLGEDAAWWYAGAECDRLAKAELYWVSPEMAELTHHAATSLPLFHPEPQDMPSERGFMVFGKPLFEYAGPGSDVVDVEIVAVAWGPFDAFGTWTHGGVWFTFYASRARMLDAITNERGRRVMARSLAPLIPDSEVTFTFRAPDKPETSDDDQPDSIIGWAKMVLAALQLMQQPLADLDEARQARPDRRRAERAGLPTRPIRIIRLRRPASSGRAGESDGPGWHHQWIVKGHWRQHWYPKRQVHRPLWIAPHVKGPEGAPLLGGDKVNVWNR
jgi:hypothetical protein